MTKIIAFPEKSAGDLDELMSYCLTEMCLSIFNIIHQLRKRIKSSSLDCFKMYENALNGVSYVSIIDMRFIWRLVTSSKADRETAEGDFTWGNYVTKIFSTIIQGHPNVFEYHVVNDRCDVELSIKDAQHQKRSVMLVGGSRNISPSSNFVVPPSRKFEIAENKIQLQEFSFKELQSFVRNQQRKFIYALKERFYSVNPVKTKQDFFCHPDESDTRMFFHISILDRRSDITIIVVNVEDTDVAVIASYESLRF